MRKPKSWNPRLARVVARDTVDLGIDDVARDFDFQILAGCVDVDEVGFH